MNVEERTPAKASISFPLVIQGQVMSQLAAIGGGWASANAHFWAFSVQIQIALLPNNSSHNHTWNLISATDYVIFGTTLKCPYFETRKEGVNCGPRHQMNKRLPLPWISNLPMLLTLKPNCVDIGLQGKQGFRGEMFGPQRFLFAQSLD